MALIVTYYCIILLKDNSSAKSTAYLRYVVAVQCKKSEVELISEGGTF